MRDDCLAFLCFLSFVDRKTKSKEDCYVQNPGGGVKITKKHLFLPLHS